MKESGMSRYVYANAIYSDSTECAGPLVICGWYRDYASAAEHAQGRESYGLDAYVVAYPVAADATPSSKDAPAAEVIDPLNYYYDSYEGRAFRALAGDAAVREQLALLKKTDVPLYEHTIKEIIRRAVAKRMSGRAVTEPGCRVFAVVSVRSGRRSSRTEIGDVVSLHEDESSARNAAQRFAERDHSLSAAVRRVRFAGESSTAGEPDGNGEQVAVYRYDKAFDAVVSGDPAKALSDSILDSIGERAGVSR
jgi:hypothetical protein